MGSAHNFVSEGNDFSTRIAVFCTKCGLMAFSPVHTKSDVEKAELKAQKGCIPDA